MSLLLHLSDLHLGSAGTEDDIGDYSKSEAVDATDRVTRTRLLRATLKALGPHLSRGGESLDAVVVTGDVTTRGRADGFGALPELLECLGDVMPEPSRIVVVPGNHDVAWGTDAGSDERYRRFVDGVRARGYVTPLLDGVDYDGDDVRAGTDSPLLVGPDYVIASINSANWCGVIEPPPPVIEEELDRLVRDGHLEVTRADEIRRMRLYDMPRISPQQFAALGESLSALSSDGTPRVRIAALHHQLLPVREEEEVKPFEAIVNLGALLAFLGDREFDLVLHGHKHADHVQPLWLPGAGDGRRAALASCGTVGGSVGTGYEVAKLVRIESSLPSLRSLRVSSVQAVGPGQTSLRNKIDAVYSAPTHRLPGETPVTIVSGVTAGDVHERLLELDRDVHPARDVICVVDRGATALLPPTTYPWPPDASDDLLEWFNGTVDWWQGATCEDGKPFTHGQRLRAWGRSAPGAGGESVDQVERIAGALRAHARTSRGVAVLIDPALDELAHLAEGFPSFSLLHAWMEGDFLHCSAFFRKQEMRFWWPVNVAEIARIQAELIDMLRADHPNLRPGAIRTHASEVVFSADRPKVDVPRIDREFWDDPERVRVLAVAVADVDAPQRVPDLARLIALLEEAAPGDSPPADGAPVAGPAVRAIVGALRALEDRYPVSPAREVANILDDLDQANQAYATNTRTFASWKKRSDQLIERLRGTIGDFAVPRAVAPPTSPSGPKRRSSASSPRSRRTT